MPLTQHELELKNTASERIRRRLLPAAASKTIWAGPGTGKACSLCDRAVDSTETEYELNGHMDDGTKSTFRFHLRCHELWQLEVARLAEN
jgi:hypothetical protein